MQRHTKTTKQSSKSTTAPIKAVKRTIKTKAKKSKTTSAHQTPRKQLRTFLTTTPQPTTLTKVTTPPSLTHNIPISTTKGLRINTTYTPSQHFFTSTTPSLPTTILPINTISTRTITLINTTSINTQTTPKTQKTKLVIPSTRPFSSNHDDEDHDHGAYERKPPSDPSQAMKITIIDREGVENEVDCKVGDNILQLMRIFQERNPKLYLEGACESSLACSTCHIILDDASYDLLSRVREASEKEEDMLDMAACLTPTSRLGCQINLVKEMDGAKISLPKFSRNFYVDGHVPQPH